MLRFSLCSAICLVTIVVHLQTSICSPTLSYRNDLEARDGILESAGSLLDGAVTSALGIEPVTTDDSDTATITSPTKRSTQIVTVTASANQARTTTTSTDNAPSTTASHRRASSIEQTSMTATDETSTSSASDTLSTTASSNSLSSSSAVTTTSASLPSTISVSSSSQIPSAVSNPLNNSPDKTQGSGNSVNAGGIAVGIVFGIIIIAGILYLAWKCNPKRRAKITTWRQERSQDPEKDMASFMDQEEEKRSMVNGIGLGVGEVEVLRKQSNDSRSQSRSHSSVSSIGPEDERAVRGRIPSTISSLHLSIVPKSASPDRLKDESATLISPIDASRPLPALKGPSPIDPVPCTYSPYNPSKHEGVGLAVPLKQTVYKSLPPPPPPAGQMKVLSLYNEAKRVSGVDELCQLGGRSLHL